ncbi:YceI family protein [Chryseobacterium sp. MFBS3-17]|uniref:YceI family protein n=1 Tax=Chryseobacterium sp. MFBS3-17 TaxID=2886689 RepID=UPI001D0E5B3B|nr:YceI family protein [Chryseobacterium sp. MFBS3-17]MCC2589963.1 YceI family protein [Chryseobacterium sp. MFBS3-17]
MKKNILAVFALATLSLTSCKKETTAAAEGAETTEVVAAEGTNYAIKAGESTINWEGGKISGDKHLGTINLQEGNLVMNDGKLVGGTLILDMNSITVTDLTDAEMKGKLEGHLKGLGDDAESQDHFFNVKTYPTATLEITNVTEENGKQMVEGNFTMKGKTDVVKFPATITETETGVTLATDEFTIDRTKWGVNHNSGTVIADLAADKVINDEIKLKASVAAVK